MIPPIPTETGNTDNSKNDSLLFTTQSCGYSNKGLAYQIIYLIPK